MIYEPRAPTEARWLQAIELALPVSRTKPHYSTGDNVRCNCHREELSSPRAHSGFWATQRQKRKELNERWYPMAMPADGTTRLDTTASVASYYAPS